MTLSPSVRRGAAGIVLACAMCCAATLEAQDATWALTNARIETVSHGVIDHGTIVIRHGLIVAVGANVAVPNDARVLDLAGRTVTPGFINLTSSLGLPQATAGARTPGSAAAAAALAAAQQSESGPVGLEPDRVIAEEIKPAQADIRGARDAGITAVLVAPPRGAFRGQSALVPLRDSVDGTEAVRSPVALAMGFQGAGGPGVFGGRYPATLLGVIAYERQAFYDAQRQGQLLERYAQNPRGMERPANDPKLAALVPVVRGQVPVFFAAGAENEMLRALNIAKEFNLQVTLVGATEGFRIADRLAALHRPVVVSVDFPESPAVTGWSYHYAQQHPVDDSSAWDSTVHQVVVANAAALSRAGVRFALASGDTLPPRAFLANVRKAIAAGLPRDTALAALTLRPAEIAGVAAQLGSVDEGKIANLVVADGDLLSDSGKVWTVFVDGIKYDPAPPEPAGSGRAAGRRGRPGDSAAEERP